nr:hypothetical protein [uncultured Pseudogulbenkiania sp.]
MSNADFALILAAIVVIPSLLAAGLLYYLVAPKGAAENAVEMGRRWLAAALAAECAMNLPLFLRHFDFNSFVVLISNSFSLGLIAYVVGWAYGKFVKFNKDHVDEADPVAAPLDDPMASITVPPETNNAAGDIPVLDTLAPAIGLDTRPSVYQRLDELNKIYRSGLISEEHYRLKSKEILDDL